jgi:hypothetical protein
MNQSPLLQWSTVGNGRTMIDTMVGNITCKAIQLDGTSLDVTLHKVKYVPELRVNLFRLSTPLKNGYKLNNIGFLFQSHSIEPFIQLMASFLESKCLFICLLSFVMIP